MEAINIWYFHKVGLPADVIKLILTKYFEKELDILFKPIFDRALSEYLFCVTQAYLKNDFLFNVPEQYHYKFLQNTERISRFVINEFRSINTEIFNMMKHAKSFLQDEYYENYINGKLTTLDLLVCHPRMILPTLYEWIKSDWLPYIKKINDLAVFIHTFSVEDNMLKNSAKQVLRNLQKFTCLEILE
jgi:hypothetical protein